MRILAIDTARTEGGVALLRNGEAVAEESLGRAPGFGEILFGTLDRLLKRFGIELADVDGFAAATGPGSFTGIRVGLSAAKALAEAHSRPLVGVSSLRALAAAVEVAPGEILAPLLDARRGELFAGFYDAAGEAAASEVVGSWDALAPRVAELSARIVSNEPTLFEADGPAAGAVALPRRAGPACLAGPIAKLAVAEIAAGGSLPPEAVEANYIQRPSARPPRPAQSAKR